MHRPASPKSVPDVEQKRLATRVCIKIGKPRRPPKDRKREDSYQNALVGGLPFPMSQSIPQTPVSGIGLKAPRNRAFQVTLQTKLISDEGAKGAEGKGRNLVTIPLLLVASCNVMKKIICLDIFNVMLLCLGGCSLDWQSDARKLKESGISERI